MQPLTPVILQLQGVRFAYPGQPPLATDWSATIGAGATQLHGDTGSGKSTLLRVMAGTLHAQGRLTLAGTGLDDDAERYRSQVFHVDPTTDRFDQMSGHDCTATLRAGDPHFDEKRWRSLVEGFALPPHLEKPMYMLSTGTRRKVFLAAALACGRALTLLDEPTGGLDAASTRCLWRTLAELARAPDRAIVVASSERIEQMALAAVIELPPR